MEGRKENEALLPQVNGEIIAIESTEDLISIAQKRIEIVGKLMTMALKITTFRDWVNQNGNPYLVHSGAEKVARLFGIKLININTVKSMTDDSKGQYYIYKTTGTASLPGQHDSIEGLGTCSQRDAFFGKASGKWLETEQIDETNIMKSSYSNFVVNAITHLLGLRNVTWDQLEEAGIDKSKILEVKYDKGKEKVEKVTTEKDKETQGKLWDLLVEMTAGNDEAAKDILKEESGFKANDGKEVEGRADVKYLTGKWLNFTYKKIKARAEKQEERVPREEG